MYPEDTGLYLQAAMLGVLIFQSIILGARTKRMHNELCRTRRLLSDIAENTESTVTHTKASAEMLTTIKAHVRVIGGKAVEKYEQEKGKRIGEAIGNLFTGFLNCFKRS